MNLGGVLNLDLVAKFWIIGISIAGVESGDKIKVLHN